MKNSTIARNHLLINKYSKFFMILFVFIINNVYAVTIQVTNHQDEDCFGTKDGWIEVTVSQGTAPYLLSIDYNGSYLANSYTQTGSSIYIYNGLENGAYDIFVTDGNNNTAQVYYNLGNTRLINWPYQPQNGTGREIGVYVASDSRGNVFAVGTFTDDITFNPNNFTSTGTINSYLAKFDQCGYLIWAVQIAGDDNEVKSLIVDEYDNPVICGQFSDNIFFPNFGPNLSSLGSSDGFLAVFNRNNGNCIWATKMGSVNMDYASSVTVDKHGQIYLFGTTSDNTFDFFNANNQSTPILTLSSTFVTPNNFLCIYSLNNGMLIDANIDYFSSPQSDYSSKVFYDPIGSTSSLTPFLFLTGVKATTQVLAASLSISYPSLPPSPGSYILLNSVTNYTINFPSNYRMATSVTTNLDPSTLQERVWFGGDEITPARRSGFLTNDFITNLFPTPYYIGCSTCSTPFEDRIVDLCTDYDLSAPWKSKILLAGDYTSSMIIIPDPPSSPCGLNPQVSFNSSVSKEFYISQWEPDGCQSTNNNWPLSSSSNDHEWINAISMGQRGQGFITGYFEGVTQCYLNQFLTVNSATDAYISRVLINDMNLNNNPAILKHPSYTSIDQPKDTKTDIIVFPTPASDYINIKIPEIDNTPKISLYNTNSQIVCSDFTNGSTDGQFIMSISNLKNGCYILQLIFDNKVKYIKVIISH